MVAHKHLNSSKPQIKNFMNFNAVRLIMLILTGYFVFPSEAQIPDAPVGKERNFELRNEHFQDQRRTPQIQSFGKAFYKASLTQMDERLHKSGDEWTPRGPFGKEDLAGTGRVNSMQFHPTDTNTWFICVAQGGVWKTTNAGASWIHISDDLPISRTSYLAVHPENPDTMYVALGDFAYLGHNLQANENKRKSHYGLGVYKTMDGGLTWSPTGLSFQQTDFEGSLIKKVFIHPTNHEEVIAVGQTGCYKSLDGGANWTKTRDGIFWDLERHVENDSVLFASTGYVHSYRTGKASILKSTDFGETWTESTVPFQYTGEVQRIELAPAPSNKDMIYALACDVNGGFFAIYRSTDGGQVYTTQAHSSSCPYNILNHDMTDADGGQGRYDLALCVDKNDPNKILTGGINIWESKDGGLNFKPVTYWLLRYYNKSLHADVHQIIQHPTNSSYFACHDGGISRSFNIIADDISTMKDDLDASTTWINYTNNLNITSFYRLSINTANPQEVIAGAQDNSTVYGDGTTFANISGGDGMESDFDDENFYRYTSSQNGRIYVYSTFVGSFDYERTISSPRGEIGEWTTPFTAQNGFLYALYGNVQQYSGGSRMGALSNFPDAPNRSYPKPGTGLDVDALGQRMFLTKRGYNSSGIDNEIWTTPDGGSTWEDVSEGLPRTLYPTYTDMHEDSTKTAWVTLSGFDSLNKVFRTDDGGSTWLNISYNLPNIPVNCVTHDEENGITYIGTDMGVFSKHFDSTNWLEFSAGLPKVIVSELEIDTSNKLLVAATFGRGLWEIGTITTEQDTIVDPPVSVLEQTQNNSLKVYPTPASEYIHIELGSGLKLLKISIVDIQGRAVWNAVEPAENHQISIDQWPTGTYFVIAETENGRWVKRFLKE
jgi:photosystem II stability/assembly factor-like uncharacterized protein